MSFANFQAWQLLERERKESSRAIMAAFKSPTKVEFSRVYLFTFPVFHKLSRMDRERQLFNATMDEHVKHEHKSNPWGKRVVFFTLLLASAVALLFFPPAALKESAAYKKTAGFREATQLFAFRWLAGYKAQRKIPVKVWINGAEAIRRAGRAYGTRASKAVTLSETYRLSEVPIQISDIKSRSVVSDGGSQAVFGDAVVLVVRGAVRIKGGGFLAAKDLVPAGATIISGPRSFAKFLLADNSQFSVGPETTLQLGLNKAGDVSVMSLAAGTFRAKVTKSQEKDAKGQPKEKMVIHTASAAMGIRGTDFLVNFSQQAGGTSLITFEGQVGMAKLERPDADDFTALQATNVVPVGAGMMSETRADQAAVISPLQLPPAQLESLKVGSDVQGPAELAAQAHSLEYGADILSTARVPQMNTRSHLYEEVTDDKIDPALRSLYRAPASVSIGPKPEDYEHAPVPDRLKSNTREFPDP